MNGSKTRNPLFLLSLLVCGCLYSGTQAETVRGFLEPYQAIELNATESGTIGKIHVKAGESVVSGQVLLNLDNRVPEAQLAIANVEAESTGNLDIARSEHDLARSRYDKLAELKTSGNAASSELERAISTLQAAEGRYRLAQESQTVAKLRVEQITADLARRILRSPIDGVVIEITRDEAETVVGTADQRDANKSLIRVVELRRLLVEMAIPARLAKALQVGTTVPVVILSSKDAAGERKESQTVAGLVEYVSPVIDPASETVQVKLMVENADGAIRSGAQILARFGE